MSIELPTTEIRALTTSTGTLQQSSEDAVPQTTIARIFTHANLGLTHTQHGIGVDTDDVSDLAQSLARRVNSSSPNNTPSNNPNSVTPVTDRSHIAASQTMVNIDRGENAVTVAIHSRPKQLISFMKCNCSDRLTMAKTKFVLYIFPLFLVIACFYVLLSDQNVSNLTFLLIVAILLSSFILSWLAILCILALLQVLFACRDAMFWCTVNRWNLEEKKAFIQAFSGVDLAEELDEQETQRNTLRIEYAQKMRANEEKALIQSTHNLGLPSDDEDNTYTDGNSNKLAYENINSSSKVSPNHDTITQFTENDKARIMSAQRSASIENDTEDSITITELSHKKYHSQNETMVVNHSSHSRQTPPPPSAKQKVSHTVSVAEVKKESEYKHNAQDSVSVATMVKKESFKLLPPSTNGKDSGGKFAILVGDTHLQATPSATSDDSASAEMLTPVPTTATVDTGDVASAFKMITPQQTAAGVPTIINTETGIADLDPSQTGGNVVIDPTDLSFDGSVDLNTPVEDDTSDKEENGATSNKLAAMMNEYDNEDLWDIGHMDVNGSEFDIWGTTNEERNAYKSISKSCTANLCIQIYRCLPWYRMRFILCIRVSCELCHTLCIFFSIFFFVLTVVFVTSNPIMYYVRDGIHTPPYITKTYSNTQFSAHGFNDGDDIVIVDVGQSKDVLTGIVNWEQTFIYAKDKLSYFTPESVTQIQEIIRENNGSKIVRVMGKGHSSNYVYTDSENILIDLREFPSFAPVVSTYNDRAECVSDRDCLGYVTVNASMSVADLNLFLSENGYSLRGFNGFDESSIGGALGSCSFGPLYEGLSIGYYLIGASLVDGHGNVRVFGASDVLSDIAYLDAIRCNLGVLGVIYQVRLEIFALEFVERMEYFYEFKNSNDTDIIGTEVFMDAYSDDILSIVWRRTQSDTAKKGSTDYSFEESVFNNLITPVSCVFPNIFDIAIAHYMRHGRYFGQEQSESVSVIDSMNRPMYYVTRYGYIVPSEVCMSAVSDAKDLAKELYSEMQMLPIAVTHIHSGNSLIGYDSSNTNNCHIEIQINSCSQSRYSFAVEFEEIIVDKYNGTGHWGYLWFNSQTLYKPSLLTDFEMIRNNLDPNGIFVNALYANIFNTANAKDTNSDLVTEIYPRNVLINFWSFYIVAVWFALMFVLYLIGSYLRVLPFINDVKDGSKCIDLKCCNDMNELDDLIEQEQQLLEQYGYDDNFDKVVEDLIDVEVLDPAINDYVTITVTFRTAFLILMGDTNYREFKYRESFAVSRNEELFERFERLGEELAWKSLYPRQCLFFSGCTLSVAVLLIAVTQASLS